jgi:RHS repeat-associated protein
LIPLIRPDSQTIDFNYDEEKGRLNSVSLPNGTQTLAYDDKGRIASITAVDGNQLSYSYDGSLPLSETWSGTVNSSLQLTYNTDFQISSATVNGNIVNYQYDNDGLLTQAGEILLSRNVQNGLLTGTQLENLTTQRSYNNFGELQAEISSFENDPVYQTHYERDKVGRIIQKTETVAGITHTFEYRYDLAGRLVEVKQNDVVTESYQYDENGNRLNNNAVYDAQDRLLQYGFNSYTYTANGELLTKNGTTYRYDVFGNLRQVQLPDKTIDYVIDARNRRIGKKVDGQLMQGFLYQGSLKPIAEFDGNGQIIARFVYGSKANVPDYLLKEGKTYRIISDHLGSPRWVVDIADGTVVQRMDYDAFGNVILDTNPGFQPFGFAGGIYDLDTGLVRFGARDYDAEIGRWTTKDPIGFGGGINFYTYVENDPINYVDLSGLCESWWDFAIETALGFIPGYDLYSAYNNQNAGWFDYGIAVLGIVPGVGKGVGLGAKGLKGSYEILDGVRRAKAAELLGQKTIPAIIEGQENKIVNLPIETLKSPNKTNIDVSTNTNMDRWMNVFDQTREGSIPPPIRVQPGTNGVPIANVGFDTVGN